MAITSSAPAEPVGGKSLVAALSVYAGVGHGVDRVGSATPPLLGPLVSNGWDKENASPDLTSEAASTRLPLSMKLRVPRTSSSPPATPVVVQLGGCGDAGHRISPLHRMRFHGVGSHCSSLQ